MQEKCYGPVRFMPGEKNGKYPHCHSLFIEGAGILIDPASDRKRLKRLRQESAVNAVWLSHWHEDHIMHLDLFEEVPLWIHHADAPPLSDLKVFLDGYGFENGAISEFWSQMMIETFHFKPRKPQGLLKNGQTFQFDTVTAEVIHTPGHTPGHLAFYFKEPKVLFMGDYDLTRFGPWYGDRQSSIRETIHSVKRLAEIPADVWLTCHETGAFEENPGDLWHSYLGVILEREQKLLSHLKTPKTIDELVNCWVVYGRPREPIDIFVYGEKAHIRKHLEALMEASLVGMNEDRYHLTEAGLKQMGDTAQRAHDWGI